MPDATTNVRADATSEVIPKDTTAVAEDATAIRDDATNIPEDTTSEDGNIFVDALGHADGSSPLNVASTGQLVSTYQFPR